MSALFSPITLGRLTLPNRIALSPMSQFRGRDGCPTAWHRTFTGMMVESGAGLGIMEATAVSPEGLNTEDDLGLFNDAQQAAFAAMIADLRDHSDTALAIQLGHSGRKASTYPALDWDGAGKVPLSRPLPPELGWTTVGPSPLAYDEGWPAPAELDDAGIARVIAAFADSARRAAAAGFSLVEVHAAHGYLLHAFRSAQSNRRTDGWGGSQAARDRIVVETARAMKAAVPDGFPIGFRLNGEDWSEGGITLDDTVELAATLKEVGVDYLVLSAGNNVPGVKLPPLVPGYMVPFAERVRRETGIATMAVGLILDGPQAEAIIRDGRADMVAIGRGFVDDPKWGWHARYALEEKVWNSGLQARVNPRRWPGYDRIYGSRAPSTA